MYGQPCTETRLGRGTVDVEELRNKDESLLNET